MIILHIDVKKKRMWFVHKNCQRWNTKKFIKNPLINPKYVITGKRKIYSCEIPETKKTNDEIKIKDNKNVINKKDKIDSEIIIKSMILNITKLFNFHLDNLKNNNIQL